MAIIAGFAMVWAIGWALTKGAEAAVDAIRTQYRARTAKFRAAHPNSNRVAAAGASLAATVRFGLKPAIGAFRDDWRKHYRQRRDQVAAKYAAPRGSIYQSGVGRAAIPERGMNLDDPEYQRLRAAWTNQDMPKTEPNSRPLRMIPGGLNTTDGGTVPNLPTAEVKRIGDIRNMLGSFGKHMQLESDDAAAALQRAKDNEAWLSQFAEQSAGVLDKDPATAAKIAALQEPMRARVEAAKMHAQAADAALAAAHQATAGVNQHSGMEEAVAATPQASSNTAAYAPN